MQVHMFNCLFVFKFQHSVNQFKIIALSIQPIIENLFRNDFCYVNIVNIYLETFCKFIPTEFLNTI